MNALAERGLRCQASPFSGWAVNCYFIEINDEHDIWLYMLCGCGPLIVASCTPYSDSHSLGRDGGITENLNHSPAAGLNLGCGHFNAAAGVYEVVLNTSLTMIDTGAATAAYLKLGARPFSRSTTVAMIRP